jgi:hypothetical protein
MNDVETDGNSDRIYGTEKVAKRVAKQSRTTRRHD